jgi:hypothetical protein
MSGPLLAALWSEDYNIVAVVMSKLLDHAIHGDQKFVSGPQMSNGLTTMYQSGMYSSKLYLSFLLSFLTPMLMLYF